MTLQEATIARWTMSNWPDICAQLGGLYNSRVTFQSLTRGDRVLVPQPWAGARVELRIKTKATLHRATNKLETGVARRVWNHYKAIQTAESPNNIFVLFCHLEEDEIRGGTVANLAAYVRHYLGSGVAEGGMAFFEFNRLAKLAKLSSISTRFADA